MFSFFHFQPRILCHLTLVLACQVLAGCNQPKNSDDSFLPTAGESVAPLKAMNAAIRKKDWATARTYSDAVLLSHADDPEVLVKVARVAFETQHPNESADLLLDAIRLEDFNDKQRNKQTMIAMVGVGRLFDGIAMLNEAIQHQPLQNETRRWLFDFQVGTEDRLLAMEHGQFLLKQRQFDLDLLMSLSNTGPRTEDATPLGEMLTLNPQDPRPLIGKARNDFDSGLLTECIANLRSIIAIHPEMLSAQMLLGQALATAGKFEELARWAEGLRGDFASNPGYWLTLGDWSMSRQQPARAARAYWEATKCDPDHMPSWSKLSSTLTRLQSDGIRLPAGSIEAARQRLDHLSRFHQLRQRFHRTGRISRTTVIEMVDALKDLGRLWEAEAWASIALTLPEDPSSDVVTARNSVIGLLRKDTPWQLIDSHPELQSSLLDLPLPEFSKLADTQTPPSRMASPRSNESDAVTLSMSLDNATDLAKIRLENEASERGLNFFGRTGDHLSKPGISLYQTLGCGGGSIDFDLDGWPDLYLIAAGGTPPQKDSAANALRRNLEGRFSDVTNATETGDRGFGQGVAIGDVNEDGFPDLLVLNYGPNCLLINNGDGTFSDKSGSVLPDQNSEWSTCGAIADLNGDGLSDLVVVNYCAGLEPVTATCPMEVGGVARSCSPVKFPAEPDRFFEGTSDGTFIDRTEDWGIKPSVAGRGLGITIGSFDPQSGIDVYIANDMSTNHYWTRGSQGGSLWTESAMPRGLSGDSRSLPQGSMGIATVDLNQDGAIDFYVTNFNGEYNTLYDQAAPGTWQDRTALADLVSPTLPMVGFGTAAVDLENDGQWELMVTNGHVDIFESDEKSSDYAQPMQVFKRNRAGKYNSIGQLISSQYAMATHVGRALWTTDMNRDGKVDVVVTHQTEPVALLVNETETQNHFLEIRLVGRESSRDAVGALVELSGSNGKRVVPQVAGDGYACTSERVIRFGLADRTQPCSVTVRWPDETSDRYDNLSVDHQYLLPQNDQAFEL